MAPHKLYPLHQCLLYGIKSKTKLAQALLLSPKRLNKLLTNKNYNVFEKDGRQIQEPLGLLKYVHKRVKDLLFHVETPKYLHSGIPKHSAITNALSHKESTYALTLDIKSFYRSADSEFIFRFLHFGLKMQTRVAKILTSLLSYEGYIPTGSAASQLIAFWAYRPFFGEIENLCSENGMVFSLYVDDISISSENRLPRNFHQAIAYILGKAKLKLKLKKIHYFGTHDYKHFTGCIVTPSKEFQVPNEQKRKLISSLKTLPKDEHPEKSLHSIRGRINQMKQIEPDIFKTTRQSLFSN